MPNLSKMTDEKIKQLYDIFRAKAPWQEWFDDFVSELEFFQSLSDEELATPENQERLWRARAITTIGPGEGVSVQGAYNDPDVINAVMGLRREWPESAKERARAVQAAYDDVMERVYEVHSAKRPQAKLARLFCAMLPNDFHTTYSWKELKAVRQFVVGDSSLGEWANIVLVRERLRNVLGQEQNMEENVHRSMFCWWLGVNAEEISEGRTPDSDGEKKPVEVTPLTLWPFGKQRKGLAATNGYGEGYREFVAAAVGGETADGIVQTLNDGQFFSKMAPNSLRSIFNTVKALGFVESREGLWFPSELGEELMEVDPPGILVERLLICVFGFSHMLRFIVADNAPTRGKIFEYLRSIYPNWTSDFAPRSLLSWAVNLDLIDFNASRVGLTTMGEEWEKRLPAVLPLPPKKKEMELIPEEEPGRGVTTVNWPSLDQVLNAFHQDEEMRRYVFNDKQIMALHLAWHSLKKKRFAIFSGLSGTGKTALLKHYSRIYCELAGVPSEENCATVPVSPDWRDPSGLLGYLNALHADVTFQAEPALKLILSAAENPSEPYFLILDEMNMARVERYFAPFLSAMETEDPLTLHTGEGRINGVPSSIPWPVNLFIGGTVNMDETTHAFSDKVLDRAFTMEFWDVELPAFFQRRASENGGTRLEGVENLLLEFNEKLASIRRHFGYRVADEILSFMETADGSMSDETRTFLVDQAVFSKILPRLRGEDGDTFRRVLESLSTLCGNHKLIACHRKLEAMTEQLKSIGITRFWA